MLIDYSNQIYPLVTFPVLQVSIFLFGDKIIRQKKILSLYRTIQRKYMSFISIEKAEHKVSFALITDLKFIIICFSLLNK